MQSDPLSPFHEQEEAGVAPRSIRVKARGQRGRVAGESASHQRHPVHEHITDRHDVTVRRQVGQTQTEPGAEEGRSVQTYHTRERKWCYCFRALRLGTEVICRRASQYILPHAGAQDVVLLF